MRTILGRFVDIEIYRNFFDEKHRIKVLFLGHELARFKVTDPLSAGFGIERVKKGNY